MRNSRKIIYAVLISLLTLTVILFVIIWQSKNSPLRVVFFDVGQGDAILISQGSQQLLIDGGRDGKLLLEKLGKFIPFWDRKIEAIIETHPDQDHIGGLIDVVGTYEIGVVLKTGMQSESQTFKKLESEIERNKIDKVEAKKDVIIKFANSAVAKVLYPLEAASDINSKDTNAKSVVVSLKVGENKFLFTGDLPTTEENKLIEQGYDIDVDFLKISHHGSKSATSQDFIEAVSPKEAIISVGKNNSYGHPNPEILQRLRERKINVLRTDEIGDIIYECANDKCINDKP